MNADDLKELASRPAWSKEVIVWVGREQGLDTTIAGQPQTTFDVLELLDEDEPLPSEAEERRALLEKRLEKRLLELRPAGPGRLILRVRNAALLARYGISLQDFFDYFGSSQTMVILCVDGATPSAKWQTHLEQQVDYNPDGIVRYLASCLPDSSRVFRELA